ncbi:MAG TPA: cytochrome c [Gemmatimonadaceae bacterium]|jgi:cytochrome c|nr:cytochrome c [Gemmatimonadaceae bacterium]
MGIAALAWKALIAGRAVLGTPGTDSLAVSKTEYDGWKIYHTYCDRCHGQDAVGSTFAPDLRRAVGPSGAMTHDAFIRVVTDGIVDKGMPAWKAQLTPEQMENIWAYLRARSSGRLAAGRPHVAPGR